MSNLIAAEVIATRIFEVRGRKAMVDGTWLFCMELRQKD